MGEGRGGEEWGYIRARGSVGIYARYPRDSEKDGGHASRAAALAFSKRIKFENKLFERLGTKDVAQSSATRK